MDNKEDGDISDRKAYDFTDSAENFGTKISNPGYNISPSRTNSKMSNIVGSDVMFN